MLIKIPFTDEMKYASDNVSINIREDGRYQCRVTISYEIDENGKRCNYKYKYIYGVDRNDVLIKRAEFIDEQLRLQNEVQITNALLTAKLHEWLYVIKRGQVKPNSFDRLECTYLHQILPALQGCDLVGVRLKDMTVLHIQNIMNYTFEKGYSYSTLKKTRDMLREFFTFYEDELPRNPMNKYKLFHKAVVAEKQHALAASKTAAKEKIDLQKHELEKDGVSSIYITDEEKELAVMQLKSQANMKDIHVFSDDEIERMKNVIEAGCRYSYISRSGNIVPSGNYKPKQGLFFLFMLNSGIRAGEAVALCYRDFDYENKTVCIHTTAVNTKERNADGSATGKRNRNFTSPKTSQSDTVMQLSPQAMAYILRMKAQEPPEYDGFVVHSKHNPIAEKTLWQRFSKLLRHAGISSCGLHSLRHTYGTKLYAATQDLKIVSQQLRHTDPSFTAKTYVHPIEARTKEILENFEI